MDETPLCWMHRDLTEAQALAVGGLLAKTWPKPDKDAAFRAARLLASGREEPARPELAARSFVLLDSDTVIAQAMMLPRELATDAGPLWVLGLAGVCSDPARRGEGLGARVVQAAFKLIDDGLAPFSLFQTTPPVRPFYEQLGCCTVDNRIVDTTAEDPEACPFWDSVVMRYPAGPGWPNGAIDLRGPGY